MNFLINMFKGKASTTKSLKLFFVMVSLSCTFCLHAEPDYTEFTLRLKPNQCVALHQGKDCYIDLELTWSAEQQGNYCLFVSKRLEALQCWRNSRAGKFKKEFVFNENVFFTLKEIGKDSLLASAELEMAWVYKKNSKPQSSWRMF